MKVIIGSDHGGYRLKSVINDFLSTLGYEIEDVGTNADVPCDYPVIASEAAKKIAGTDNLGILVCGTGIGMSIAANKVKGVRAALCHDTFSARMSREHNNSNILCLGERVTGCGPALDIVKTWLETGFSGDERHKKRLELVAGMERE